MNETSVSICEKCGGELQPGGEHDAVMCGALARLRQTMVAHPNFGRARPEPRRMPMPRPGSSRPTPAPAAQRGPVGIERSLPPEREFAGTIAPENYGERLGSSDAEFHARVDVTESVQRLLEHLRRHFGDWVPMVELQRVMAVEMVHSRVAEARELVQDEEDIDQENRFYEPTGKVHSFYRLCLKAESHRLKRKQEKDRNQVEFKE